MAKLVKLTANELSQLRAEFEAAIKDLKLSDGKLSFTKSFSFVDRKAKVYVTAEAWAKMQGLVSHFDKEVAWHGVAYRGEDETKDEYFITDILVYPQTVTGTNVDMNVGEYDKWLRDNDEDDRFFNIHMQGHSHVNMGVTPSAVDLQHYDEILNMLPGKGFYIFMILNKKWDKMIKVYDLQKNMFFDTVDCTLTVLPPPLPDGAVFCGVSEEEAEAALQCVSQMRINAAVDGFVSEAEKMVKDRVYTPYVGSAPGYYTPKTEPKTPVRVVPKNEPIVGGGKKRKGKRRKTSAGTDAEKKSNTKRLYGAEFDDDDDYEFCRSFYDYWK